MDRRLWVLFLGRLITSTGYTISFPFFAIYFTDLGVSPSVIGAVMFAGALGGALGKLAGGELCDRVGRKRVMLASMSGRAVGTLAIAFLAMQPQPSWLAISAVFVPATACGFLFEPASHAMVADLADPTIRVRGFSLLRIGGNLGWAIGGIAGGLIGNHGYPLLFFTTTAITVAALALVGLWVSETAPARAEPPRTARFGDMLRLSAPGFPLFCVASALIFAVMAQMTTPLSIFAKAKLGLEPGHVGFLFTLNGLIIVLFQYPAAHWIERTRLTKALWIGCVLYAAGYAAVGSAEGFAWLCACIAVVSAGELLVAPATMSLAANLAPADQRGRYLGGYGMYTMLGRCVGPLAAGRRDAGCVCRGALGALGGDRRDRMGLGGGVSAPAAAHSAHRRRRPVVTGPGL